MNQTSDLISETDNFLVMTKFKTLDCLQDSTKFKTLDCLQDSQELLIASKPQGMYLGNRY